MGDYVRRRGRQRHDGIQVLIIESSKKCTPKKKEKEKGSNT